MTTERSEHADRTSTTAHTPGTPPRQRIRFPNDSELSRTLGPPDERSPKTGSNPPLPSSILRRHDVVREPQQERRRVRSVDARDLFVANGVRGRAQPVPGPSHSGPGRGRAVSHTGNASNAVEQEVVMDGDQSFDSSLYSDESELGAEGDAQDQTDPKVLADVQRALKYKSRVEARLKAAKSNPGLKEYTFPASPPSSSLSSPSQTPFPSQSLSGANNAPFYNIPKQTEVIDFSPSVGATPLHPVPSSSNDGTTLDWSGDASDDDRRERKWSIPLSRKAPKDKPSPLGRKGVVEKQESLYADKLARIREKATPQTLRKAEITRTQLQRRYNSLHSSSTTRGDASLNIASAVRWFANQDDLIKRLLDEAEPLSWLRHLMHKSGEQPHPRLPWHLTALIVEEHIRSCHDTDAMSSIREDFSTDIFSESGLPSLAANYTRSSSSRPPSFQSMDAIVANKRGSDDLISFEPLTQSRRNSLENDSHRSIDKQMRRWRNSMPGMVDSPHSSLGSLPNGIVAQQQGATSPISSRSNLRDFAKRIRSRRDVSDEGSSSALDSLSEDPKSPDKSTVRKPKRPSPVAALDLKSQEGLGSDEERDDISQPQRVQEQDNIPLIDTPRAEKSFPSVDEKDFADSDIPPQHKVAPPKSFIVTQRKLRRYRAHASLPSSPRSSATDLGVKRRTSDDQERSLALEYEQKKETLAVLKLQNIKIKALLNTASRTIQEYDEMQHSLSTLLGLPYNRMSLEVLDALSHDPAAVTGNTRRLTGWRAVEDIHARRTRQIEVLQAFITSLPTLPLSVSATETGGVFEEPTLTISALLDQLHDERQHVLDSVHEAGGLLLNVKEMRDQLKPDFDATERHTSANYPELVQLEALLDKFVNKRNQLWRLGETSLSLVLSSSAPFMKTFGRPIWDDVHDFLVIPWYRNDFSGEAEWYPVKFPKRDVAHWLKLTSLGLCAPFGLTGTLRAIVTLSAVDIHLDWTEHFVLLLLLRFIHLLFVLGLSITAVILLATVLGEFAILFWWTAWIIRIVQ